MTVEMTNICIYSNVNEKKKFEITFPTSVNMSQLLGEIYKVGFFFDATCKFLRHVSAEAIEKNALIQKVISNFYTQLST